MTRILAICSVVAAGVGLADALIGAQADLAAVFATVLLLLLALLAGFRWDGRPSRSVRTSPAGCAS